MAEKEKEPKWFKFWKRSNKEQIEAVNRLTEAMVNLEKTREEGNRQLNELLSSPERLGEVMSQAVAIAQSRVVPPLGVAQVRAVEGGTQVEGALLLPSPELVKEQVETVTKAVMGKMEEMEKHVAQAVSELPPNILERIAEKIKAGEDFTLRRRHGCVHIDFGSGDDEFYLRL